MKTVILAGGYGTRLTEETIKIPKPMIEIGGKPILWHIMKIYSAHGINEFVVCLGYKGYAIKEYFANYFLHTSDVTLNIKKNSMEVHANHAEPWTITLVNTGEDTMTGGRLKRVQQYIGHEDFCMTYGDGVGNVDISALVNFHHTHRKIATVTATQMPGRFGTLSLQGSYVTSFQEKPMGDGGWVNGGFFVLSPRVFDYIEDDQTIWERQPIEQLACESQMEAYFHKGFWQPMDTLRDKQALERLWESKKAPWKIWE